MRKSQRQKRRGCRAKRPFSYYRALLKNGRHHSSVNLKRKRAKPLVGSGWYQRRVIAERKVASASNSTLSIQNNYYKGDAIRHWMYCECGNTIFVSLAELLSDPDICPYCHGIGDPMHLGDIRALQAYVLNISNNSSYLFADRPLGTLDDFYRFRCLIHSVDYGVTLRTFLDELESTRGCQLCGFDTGFNFE